MEMNTGTFNDFAEHDAAQKIQTLVTRLGEVHPDLAEWAVVRIRDGWTAEQLIGRLRVLTMVAE
jgi:hypothetical protein